MAGIKVQCCRCRNIHMESDRINKRSTKFKKLYVAQKVCPRCGAHSYYEHESSDEKCPQVKQVVL